MKTALTLLTLFLGLQLSAQDITKSCNQLPYAKVDEGPMVKGDLISVIEDELPTEMKSKGEFTASYKVVIDCKGEIELKKFISGNMNEEQKAWLEDILKKTEWLAGTLNGKEVSSIIVMKISIINGQVTIED